MFYTTTELYHKKDILEAIHHASHPIAITGAGISTSSGLPTIESTWLGRSLEELFKLDQAHRHIIEYQQAYQAMMTTWLKASPNPAHHLLAERNVRIITQNIDGLHDRAGSYHLIELHGSLTRLRCHGCRSLVRVNKHSLNAMECPACGHMMWPDIVFEGEHVKQLVKAIQWMTTSDLLFIIGTRLQMNPVSQLPLIAMQNHIPIIEINQEAEQTLQRYLSIKSNQLL